MGVLTIAAAGPQVVAPITASMVTLYLGGYPSLFLVGALIGIAGALAIGFVRSVR